MGPERDTYTQIQQQNEKSQDILSVDEIIQDQNEGSQETIIFKIDPIPHTESNSQLPSSKLHIKPGVKGYCFEAIVYNPGFR